MLALARCLGRFSYMRIDYNSAARNDKQGSDYPKGFLDDWNRLTQLLTDAARRDRAMVLTIFDTPALWDFPPVIADAVRAGADDGYDIDFRPDFWSLPTDYGCDRFRIETRSCGLSGRDAGGFAKLKEPVPEPER